MYPLISGLILSTLFGCSVTPRPPAQRVHIIPYGVSDWYVGWSRITTAFIDGVAVNTRQALTLSGERPHSITYDGKTLSIPKRSAAPCQNTRFAVLGDGRASVDGLGPSAYWPGLLREVIKEGPDLILNSGDLVKNGRAEREWDAFLSQTPEQPPMVVVRGNHDRGVAFDHLQLAPDFVFWFRVGPALVIGVDSEITLEALPETLQEVDRILSEQSAAWRILLMHRPIWSRGNHGSNERGWNDRWVPLIDQHEVDLVIAGHDHNYERFCRQTGLGSQRKCTPGKGTVYVVSGGAATFTNPVPGIARGVPSVTKIADAAMSKRYSGSHHYVILDISPSTLSLRAQRSRTGNLRPPGLIDELTLTKESALCR